MSPIFPGREERKPILFILSGSINEFDYIARKIVHYFHGKEHCPFDLRYLNDEQKIYGHRNGLFFCYGNWFRRPEEELAKFQALLRHLEFRELGHSDIFGVEEGEDPTDYRTYQKPAIPFFTEEEFEL